MSIPATDLRRNLWGANTYPVYRDGVNRGWAWDRPRVSQYDFELAPWLRAGKVLWLEPGDESLTLREGPEGCPFVGLDGRRLITVIANGVIEHVRASLGTAPANDLTATLFGYEGTLAGSGSPGRRPQGDVRTRTLSTFVRTRLTKEPSAPTAGRLRCLDLVSDVGEQAGRADVAAPQVSHGRRWSGSGAGAGLEPPRWSSLDERANRSRSERSGAACRGCSGELMTCG